MERAESGEEEDHYSETFEQDFEYARAILRSVTEEVLQGKPKDQAQGLRDAVTVVTPSIEIQKNKETGEWEVFDENIFINSFETLTEAKHYVGLYRTTK